MPYVFSPAWQSTGCYQQKESMESISQFCQEILTASVGWFQTGVMTMSQKLSLSTSAKPFKY